MKPIMYGTIGGGAAVMIAIVIILVSQSTPQYALLLNPIVQTGTSTDMHVMVQNTGKAPLTNVRVDYGPGAKVDIIPVLNPGEKVWLSPSNIDMNNNVVVTDDQGVTVTKPYSQPIKTPLADSD
ncbi:MAG: hypothetical protein PXX83_07985 [Candidatus Nitrosotalea sp.]|nr:hypothetical protein [Candidatus Nitrosotalea sp.]